MALLVWTEFWTGPKVKSRQEPGDIIIFVWIPYWLWSGESSAAACYDLTGKDIQLCD